MMGWLLGLVVHVATPGARIPVDIQVHDGLGTREAFVAWGRVVRLEDHPTRQRVQRSHHVPDAVRNSLDLARAFTTDEVGQVDVLVTVVGKTYAMRTDDEGWYELSVAGLKAPLPAGAHAMTVDVAGRGFYRANGGTGTLHVLPAGGVAIISDVDDTVVQTHVTDTSRMVRQALTQGARDLQPVPGVAEAFQRALKAGATGVIYVSGSPRNLQPRLREYLDVQHLPPGPILLKDAGKDNLFEQERYKQERIDGILARLPTTSFVLVGDDGERDPEIYRAVRTRHANRRFEVVIRATAGTPGGNARVTGMRVVGDYVEDPDVVASAVRALRAPQSDAGR